MQTKNKQTFLHHILFPGVMGLVVATVFILRGRGVDPDFWSAYTYNGAAILLLLAEYIIPRNPSWNYFNRGRFQVREAAIETFFYFVVDSFSGSLMFPIAHFLAEFVKGHFQAPGALPIPGALQFIILVLGLDFVRYWIHRGYHRFGFLWRFHALHHMAPRLSAVSTRRSHPLDDLFLYLPESVLVMVLGFDTRVVAGFYAIMTVMALVKHTNVDIPVNTVTAFFNLPRFHLRHHQLQSGTDLNCNYAELTTVWDRVFGTFNGEPLALDHQVGVQTKTERGIVRELFGWLYLPIEKF
jgi:sterol desaturase/sphingolipid hydroxylase (fatty acid hydroxylase superfamily)